MQVQSRFYLHYSLRYNKKQLDLSLTYRLSGLPSGAQLELVQASRSPSVINVALQLPSTEQTTRLTDKVPSNTSLWQLLRRFESGIAGSGQVIPSNLNFTQRGVPSLVDGNTGAGRLYYEMPVLNIMGRELSSFSDLQKTLAQLGFNSGSCLLRLTFKNTGQPLEEAMAQISQFFKETEQETAGPSTKQPSSETSKKAVTEDTGPDRETRERIEAAEQVKSSDTAEISDLASTSRMDIDDVSSSAPAQTSVDPPSSPSAAGSSTTPGNKAPGVHMTIYAAPNSNTPTAAALSYNPADYEPTVDHAKLHQARLTVESRNRRLPSDLELAEVERSKADKFSAVETVQIRVKMPDQQIAEATFDRLQTSEGLYNWVKSLLAHGDQPFTLRYPNAQARQVTLDNDQKRLITDLKFQGRVLVHLLWEDSVPAAIRKKGVLKPEFAGMAQQLQVVMPADIPETESSTGKVAEPEKKKPASKEDIETKMKRFLKFGKK